MNLPFYEIVFFVLAAALGGGLAAKLVGIQPLVGYILSGVIFGLVFPSEAGSIGKLAEIGTILLLFSIGIELSFDRLSRVAKVAILGGVLQILATTSLAYFFLTVFGFGFVPSLILAAGFSLSSTAIVVKILNDRGETETIGGEVMVGWLLIQDLAVVPMMVILPIFTSGGGGFLTAGAAALLRATVVVGATFVLGKLIVPAFIHKVASFNSKELLSLAALVLAVGTAVVTSFFGISPALGAFLAGVVISESQENHAIFGEIRPMSDLFVGLFFVTLGFLVTPSFVVSNLGTILLLSIFVILIKIVIVFFVSNLFGYKGRVAITTSLGLAQVGEFSFILFSAASSLKLLSPEVTSIGISTAIITLLATPILFKMIVPLARRLRRYKLFASSEGTQLKNYGYENHIIICGYGRVGSWVGKGLAALAIPFVVVDYNQNVVNELSLKGISVIYGDPSQPEVLESAGLSAAKVIILAIPDRVAQETLIAHVQTVAPKLRIICRAHQDADVEKLKILKVDKIVQPEFEAAISIVKAVGVSLGKSKEEITKLTKSLRLARGARK